jgi:hypothetical protein
LRGEIAGNIRPAFIVEFPHPYLLYLAVRIGNESLRDAAKPEKIISPQWKLAQYLIRDILFGAVFSRHIKRVAAEPDDLPSVAV